VSTCDTSKLYVQDPKDPTGRVCIHCGAAESPMDPTPHRDDPNGDLCPVSVIEGLRVEAVIGEEDSKGRTEGDGYETLREVEAWARGAVRRALAWTRYPTLDSVRLVFDLEQVRPERFEAIRQSALAPRWAAEAEAAGKVAAQRRESRVRACREELAALDAAQADFLPGAYERRRLDVLSRFADVCSDLGETPPPTPLAF